MVNCILNFCTRPRDLGLEQSDALIELVHRKRIEVLLAQLGSKVVLATRQVFFCVHALNVDPGRGDVNKTRTSTEDRPSR